MSDLIKAKETAIKHLNSGIPFSRKTFDLFRDDKEIVLMAVKESGIALKFASDRLKDDKEVVLEAVKQNNIALGYASDRLKDNKEVVSEAVNLNGKVLCFASDNLRDDVEVALGALRKNCMALKSVSERIRRIVGDSKEPVIDLERYIQSRSSWFDPQDAKERDRWLDWR